MLGLFSALLGEKFTITELLNRNCNNCQHE